MRRLSESEQRFLEEPFYGVVTTLRADGSPHSTVVWVDTEDGIPRFNTAYPRTKPRNLDRDPRVALLVVDPEDPYRWLAVDGRVELTAEGADAHIDALSAKYTGNPVYGGHNEREQRVTVRILPERVDAHKL